MTSRLFWPAPAHSAAQWVFSLRDIRAVFGTRTESRTPLFPTALHNCHRANEAARRRIHCSHVYASIAIIMCHSTHTFQRIPLVRAAAAASMRVTLRSGGREGGEASSRELRVHMLITRGTTQLIAIGTIAQEAHIAHTRPMYNRIGDDAGGRPLVRRVARATKYAKASRHAAFAYGHETVHSQFVATRSLRVTAAAISLQSTSIRPHALRSMSISGATNSGTVISAMLTVINHIHPSARSGCRALL